MAGNPHTDLPKSYLCYRTAQSPITDGSLRHPAWDNASWTDDFVDIEGDAKPAPTFRTHVKMLWDDEFFYIGARLEEPHVWATLTEHDSVIFQDNDFEVFIDPDGDNHNYYEIEINALNTEWDLRLAIPYRDGGSGLNEWEIPGLQTRIHIDGTLNDPSDTDEGWSVEMAIPWRVLGEFANRPAPPRNGDQWRVNFSRVEWDIDIVDGKYHKIPNRPEHNWVWSPQGVIDMHRPEKWGYVQFSARAPGTDSVQPDPSASAREYLIAVYYAQIAYKDKNGQWATNLPALALMLPAINPTLTVTGNTYEATAAYSAPDGERRMHLSQNSRLWSP